MCIERERERAIDRETQRQVVIKRGREDGEKKI